jgi:DNA-binding NarL/FixJ family response regulator
MDKLRLLLADDHPLFRKGLRGLLATVPEVEVVGEAASGPEAVRLAAELRPDLVLMDLQMPEGGGLEAIRAIVAANPEARLLVITLFADDDSVFAALRAGARGYVLKDADEDEIVRALRAVAHGEAIFSPAIAARVMRYFASPPAAVPREAFPTLTDREREILNAIAQGHNNLAIAQSLSLSQKTVSNYVSSIFSKLQVADRAQAIVRAREAGLGGGERGDHPQLGG